METAEAAKNGLTHMGVGMVTAAFYSLIYRPKDSRGWLKAFAIGAAVGGLLAVGNVVRDGP